jgi:hypothetical protein
MSNQSSSSNQADLARRFSPLRQILINHRQRVNDVLAKEQLHAGHSDAAVREAQRRLKEEVAGISKICAMPVSVLPRAIAVESSAARGTATGLPADAIGLSFIVVATTTSLAMRAIAPRMRLGRSKVRLMGDR